jgi:hypothetical protein
MKTFKEVTNDKSIFEDVDLSHLTEAEINEAVKFYHSLNEAFENGGIEEMEVKIKEGLVGGIAGFLMGPTIGKVIARALGIERGILYDMFTSRLVGAALGSAIQKNL